MEIVKSGNIEYKIIDGTAYHKETPDEVVRVLESARNNHTRIKLYYGDVKTGRDWNEEFDTVGTIGRSTGSIKVPLLIKTSRSYGGGALLDDSIVKIKDAKTGRILYQHSKYQMPSVEIVKSDLPEYEYNTMVDGKLHGRHKTLRSAEMLKKKLMEDGGKMECGGCMEAGGKTKVGKTEFAIGIDFQSEFSTDDQERIKEDVHSHVADMVKQGYTQGELVGEEPDYRGWWNVDVDKDDEDEDIRNEEIARLIGEGYTSGYYPTFTFGANVWSTEEKGKKKKEKGGVADIDYENEILPALKSAVEDSWKPIAKKYHLYEETSTEIERKSGEGFIAFTSGGYMISAFNPLTDFDSTGIEMPTVKMQKVVDDWIDECHSEALDKTGEEEGDDYFNEYQECLGGIAIDFNLRAVYYSPDNTWRNRGELSGTHSIHVLGIINDDSPKEKRDSTEEAFSFSSIEELKEKLPAAIKKVKDWFKADKMEKGGRLKSAVARERKYTSQEEHEKGYKNKRKSRVRYYQNHEMGGTAGKYKISYQKHWHPTEGTTYNQTVKIDNRTYDHLRDAVASEIAMGRPQKDKYVWTSGYEFYLKPLVLENGRVYLNHTQTRFINMFLKLPLKDRNTMLRVVDKLSLGGLLDSGDDGIYWLITG